jgi:hypothetical protein
MPGQQTVQVDREVLVTLTQESLEKASGIQKLEKAATELYKALQAGQDTGVSVSLGVSSQCLIVRRNGCYHGAIRRIQDAQFTVLQTCL